MVKGVSSKGNDTPKKTSHKKVPDTYKADKRKLNELFKSIKGKTCSPGDSKVETPKKAEKASAKKKEIHVSGSTSSKDSYSHVPISGTVRRRTEDNLPIYTPEELNIGKGGGTDLCPFDCSCCF